MDKSRILIVDDEPKVIHLVREVLTAAGYSVLVAMNGERAIDLVAVEQPDLIILDILLNSGIDGFHVAQRVREFSNTPIIMLTAKVRESDLLHGFESGADDYITKPFSSKELLARIQAVLKRVRQPAAADEAQIVCGSLVIDLARHRVNRQGQEIHLTPIEYNLLHEMAVHRNQVLLHDQLLVAVWGPEYRNDTEYLRAYIHNLRQKIEDDPTNPKIIQRCPGVGYMLACEETESCG